MRSLKQIFNHLLDEVKQDGELRSLLMDDRREDERPHVKIGGQDHVLGLIDDQPMLMRTADRMLVNPEMIDNNITEMTWRLKS